MKIRTMKIFAIMVCTAAMALGVFADAKSDAHARRKARKNSVSAIVKNGDASEGANGYLMPKSGMDKDKLEVVNAENKDRKIGYETIAKEHKTSVSAISKAAGRINRKKTRR